LEYRATVSAAGYSGTPLWRKLGIKDGGRVELVGAPDRFEAALAGRPEGAVVARRAGGRGTTADVVILFTTRAADLARRFGGAAARLSPAGGLWVAWPKKASGVTTDLVEGRVREIGLAAGLVDNKVCAIDEIWSGLRFVVRVRDR
jgi:hypothetical protein